MKASYPFRSEKLKCEYLAYYDSRAQAVWPQPSEERIVETVMGPTFVRINGPENGEPLVLLPGMTANSLMWAPNIPAWSQIYRTYAVDSITDFGRSASNKIISSPREYMLWLDSLFNELGLEKLNLAGLSYGGWLTALYALYKPQRLKKIVLLAPGATICRMNFVFMFKSLLIKLFPATFGNWMFSWLFADGAAIPEKGPELLRSFVEDFRMGEKCFTYRGFVNLTVLSESDWRKIQMPALVMIGDHEKIYDGPQALELVKKKNPAVFTRLIRGAGHDLSVTRSEEVNACMLDFLAQGRI